MSEAHLVRLGSLGLAPQCDPPSVLYGIRCVGLPPFNQHAGPNHPFVKGGDSGLKRGIASGEAWARARTKGGGESA